MPPPAQANPAHDPPAPANGGPANGPANGTAPPKKPSPKAAAGPMKKTAKTSQKAAAAEKDDSATTEPRRAARAEPLADAAARAKFGALSAEKRVADCLHREHWEDLYSLFCSLDAEKRYGIVEGYMEKTKFPMDVTRNKVFADRTVERGEEGQQSKVGGFAGKVEDSGCVLDQFGRFGSHISVSRPHFRKFTVLCMSGISSTWLL